MGERLIFDIETNGLLAEVSKLHIIQLGPVDGDDVDLYCDALPGYRPLSEGLVRIREASELIGHNVIGYDYQVINKLYPGTLRPEQMTDTLVMARLFDPEQRDHRLMSWGGRLGVAKGDYSGGWETCNQEMLDYARQDVVVTRALYHHVKEVLSWGESCALEHDTQWAIAAQERNGFAFDVPKARELEVELLAELADIAHRLKTEWFLPIERTRTFTPKVNNSKLGYKRGIPFTKRWTEEFDPGSRAQVAERLQLLGWKPKDYGKTHVPTVDEKILGAMKHPVAAILLRYYRVSKLLGQLSTGKGAWLKLEKDGRIYGRVNPNGAVTGRMTHFSPNVAQADKEMRAVWIVRKGRKLVGCDAEGLEARMLGHYLARYDGGKFSDRVVNGSKEARTDIHSANLKALIDAALLPSSFWDEHFKPGRDGAKTILYALIYGAGDWKLGETVRQIHRDAKLPLPKVPSKELGILTRRALAKSMVGIDKLVKAVASKVDAPGYVIGLDGRHIYIRSKHSALNTLLQGAGAIVMKKALQLFWRRHRDTHGDLWAFCANVHDEVQMEVNDDGDLPERMGREFAECIAEAGKLLSVRCPLAGAFDIGDSWLQTH